MTETAVIRVQGLKKHFPIFKGIISRAAGFVYAVDGISFEINDFWAALRWTTWWTVDSTLP